MTLKLAVGATLVVFAVTVTAVLSAALIVKELRQAGGTGANLTQGFGEKASASATVNPGLTLAEIAAHNSAADCWLMIEGQVYGVTPFLNSHPGGAGVITPFCGQDATTAFNTKGMAKGINHSALARQMLTSYSIGPVGGTAAGVTPGTTPLAKMPTLIPTVKPSAGSSGSSPGNQNVSLTPAEIASHNSTADCWLVINSQVYNVTSYLNSHPGGVGAITPFCGGEATNAFNTKGGRGGGHSGTAASILANYRLGSLGSNVPAAAGNNPAGTTVIPATVPVSQPTAPPNPPPQSNLTLTTAEVAAHNSAADCWLLINSQVYNVTSYLNSHPGGVNAITPFCGGEATNAFNTRGGRGGGHSNSATNLLNNYRIGALNSSVAVPTAPPAGGGSSLPASVAAKYPGATVTSINEEDDGRIEMKINYNGQCREIKINSSGAISEDKSC